MKASAVTRVGLGALVLFVAGVPVFALAQQQQAPGAPATDLAPAPVSSVALSPKEQLVAADAGLARMKNSSTAIRRQLDQARREKDVVKVLCLDDKLSQADVAVRSADERHAALAAAAAKNDSEAATHESTVLGVLAQRSAQVTAEANQCIGEESSFNGTESSVTNVDPSISKTEVGGLPLPGLGDIVVTTDPPQCTSCAR